MASQCAAAHSSFTSALSDPDGHWVIQELTDNTSSMLPSSVRIGWYIGSGGSNETVFYANSYPPNYKVGVYVTRFVDLYWNGSANECYDYGTGSYVLDYGETLNPYSGGVYLSTYLVTYPDGYEAAIIPDGTAIDEDGDELNSVQELTQGTSDASIDTNGDGLSDYIELVWNPDRSDVFCKPTSPYTCAYPDPLKKRCIH